MDNKRQAEIRLRENLLEAMVEATLQGHELSEWQSVDETGNLRYQAICVRCGGSVYVSSQAPLGSGLLILLLGPALPPCPFHFD